MILKNIVSIVRSICERILEDCTIDSIRHGAIQILCYSYSDVGKEELAVKLANEMPTMYSCKEHLLSHIYKGEKKIEQCQKVLLSMIDSSSGIIGMLASNELMGKEVTVLQKIELIETANNLSKQKYKSLLANRCTFNPKNVGRNWEGTETGMVLNILQRKVFDCIRETEDFKQLVVRLNNMQQNK